MKAETFQKGAQQAIIFHAFEVQASDEQRCCFSGSAGLSIKARQTQQQLEHGSHLVYTEACVLYRLAVILQCPMSTNDTAQIIPA